MSLEGWKVSSALGPALVLSALAACSSSTEPVDAGPGPDAVVAPDAAPVVHDDAAEPLDAGADDAGEVDSGEHPDASEPRPPDVCDALSLPRRPFDEGASGMAFGDRAGDFTVRTLSGETWNLREQWTGCESYVFVVYLVGTYGDALFRSGVEGILRNSAPNVHYFFASYEPDEDGRRVRLETLKERIDTAIVRRFPTDEEQAAQQRRVHYVVDRITEVGGSVGPFFADYTTFARTSVVDIGDGRRAPAPALHVFGIDRDQRWDPGDNLNEYVGGPVLLDMAGYLGPFYDFKARLEDRLASEAGVVTRTLVDTTTTARVFTTTVALPGAAEMEGFDTLELDVRINCSARNPFACSEWDRIANVFLCTDGSCAERHEIARWITPYWRRGEQRWAIDASPMLGLMRAGGSRTFMVETGPSWERATSYDARVTLRLSTRGNGKLRAMGAVPAFGGGVFDSSYNTREPLRFTAPASARRVELVTILSGHGQTANDNCAEWCDHRHRFTVEGEALPEIVSGAGIGSTRGCAERAKDGVPPGQWGNWGPQRAFWCPGLPVDALSTDLTPHVTPGVEAELRYSANFRGGMPRGGDIALSSYVVWYE